MANTTLGDSHNAFGRKERKIRSSCNACGSQKIRCGKQRPKCCRCTKMGLDCEYSVSMRTGERSRFVFSPGLGSDAESPAPTEAPQSTESSTWEQFGDLPQGLQQDIDWMLLEIPELRFPVDQALYLGNNTFDDFGTSVKTDDAENGQRYTSSGLIPTPPIQDYDFGSMFHGQYCYNGKGDEMESQPQPSNNDLDMQIPQPKKAHDCLMVALEIVADFHVLAQGCFTAAKDAAGSQHGVRGADQPREMSAVLSDNSGVLQELGSILDCKCFLRKEVQAMVYLAIDKVVCWYVAILGEDGTSTEHPSLLGIVNHIPKPPAVMGTNCRDNETQRLISAQLVLEQLKEHVNPLIH